jgi:hypothetical protein
MEKMINSYKYLVGKPEKKKRKDNIKIDLKEVGCGMAPSCPGQKQVAGFCERSNGPKGPARNPFRCSATTTHLMKDSASRSQLLSTRT